MHIVMQCPYHGNTQGVMYETIDSLKMEIQDKFHNLEGEEKYLPLMGKNIAGTNPK